MLFARILKYDCRHNCKPRIEGRNAEPQSEFIDLLNNTFSDICHFSLSLL